MYRPKLCIEEIPCWRNIESNVLTWLLDSCQLPLITSNTNALYDVTTSADHVTYTDGELELEAWQVR